MNEMINPLNIITPELLGITDVVITNMRVASDGSIHIEVKSTLPSPSVSIVVASNS